MFDLFLFLLVLMGMWFWWDSMGVKEVARLQARQACVQADVQLLDDTVAVTRIRIRRARDGRLRVYRFYRFDFTPDGEARFQGQMEFLGRQRMMLDLGAYPYIQ